jgi:hypothetical protein
MCLSLFSIPITKYLTLNNLYGMEVYVSYVSGGSEVQKRGPGICLVSIGGLGLHCNMAVGMIW